MNRLVRFIVPNRLRALLGSTDEPEPFLRSYSQEGEDMVLRQIFQARPTGFYVDVGAHHPQRFSNTYYFYLRGWSGINIDAMPGSMKLFESMRDRDINLEYAISDQAQTLTYYIFNEPALNGFSKELAESRNGRKNFRIIEERPITTRTLAEVLAKHLPPGRSIEFLSVDVEGLDYQVLNSSDWDKYRPMVVLAEDLKGNSFEQVERSPVRELLMSKGYELYCKTPNTLIFKEKGLQI